MPFFKKIDPNLVPPPKIPRLRNSGIVGRKGEFKSKEKPPSYARKRPILGKIFGEELFLTNLKKEKEIVIGFHPFTDNGLRISKCGKFIIEKITLDLTILPEDVVENLDNSIVWNLFYFKDPILDYDPEKCKKKIEIDGIEKEITIYHIPSNANRLPFLINFNADLNRIENSAIMAVRWEFFLDREKRKAELKEKDIKDQELIDLFREKLEKEEELKNELATRELSTDSTNNLTENAAFENENSSEKKISDEIKKEEIPPTNTPETPRRVTGVFFRKI